MWPQLNSNQHFIHAQCGRNIAVVAVAALAKAGYLNDRGMMLSLFIVAMLFIRHFARERYNAI